MPANLDKDGHIVITDSMPEEIKQMAMRLNADVDKPEEEEPDILSASDDTDDDDLIDGTDEDDDDELIEDLDEDVDYTAVSDTEAGGEEPTQEEPQEESISSEDLDNLNNMFE